MVFSEVSARFISQPFNIFFYLSGKLILVGGNDGTHSLCSTEIFDPFDNTWTPGPTMTTCRTNVAVAMVGNRLWAVGGFSGNLLLTVERPRLVKSSFATNTTSIWPDV